MILQVKQFNQEGDIANEYNPLKNMVLEEGDIEGFDVELNNDLDHPLEVDCQPSYDGTVNIIINDDKNPPRMVNSRFTRLENNRYKIVNRNQKKQTNLYEENYIDAQTRLFRNINSIPKFDLQDIKYSGQLKGGNYTFYLKFADDDYNQTDIVAESGQISVFKGNYFYPNSVSGAIVNERTDKSIELKISNIDTSFSNIYIYYTREYCDQNGIRLTEAMFLTKPYRITDEEQIITITGYEEETEISQEELNIQYNYINSAKTQAQVQNRLFFGNVSDSTGNEFELQNLSYYWKVTLRQSDSIGFINENYLYDGDFEQTEYYNPKNIYYKLGYWPDEMYRLGIVYILNDDSLSAAYNLRGIKFDNIGDSNITVPFDKDTYKNNPIEAEAILNESTLENTYGVFKNPKVEIIGKDSVKPIYYEISASKDLLDVLRALNIKGFFFVRQKRIQTTFGQGYAIAIDKGSFTPIIPVTKDDSTQYLSESFLDNGSRLLSNRFNLHQRWGGIKQNSALLCMDACVEPQFQSLLDGSEFILNKDSKQQLELTNSRLLKWKSDRESIQSDSQSSNKLVFVNSDTSLLYIDDFGYRTRAGSGTEVKLFEWLGKRAPDSTSSAALSNLVRGVYCPIIGVNGNLDDNCIYNIKIKNYSESLLPEYFKIRGGDNSEFYAISDRFELSDDDWTTDVYRGDCFTSTVTFRINRNFLDPDVPSADIIIEPNTWNKNWDPSKSFSEFSQMKDVSSTTDVKDNWYMINRADVNTVPLGIWLTYKCLSNYNLGLRAENGAYTGEQALVGNKRSFYPLHSISTSPSYKIEESFLLNAGYNSTVGRIRQTPFQNVPYIKDIFDNRVMWSNVDVSGDFKNGYRVFQGLSYQDIDRQYGAIVKLLPWVYGKTQNLLCVFEHGIGILPINEKALIQTTTEQNVHMYGAGVMQEQITVISQDYGSIWQESILRTQNAVYGVDTYAKKIWCFSNQNGLETISDMKVQRFLNDNILLKEGDKYPTVALKNVKTHYNNYKGDVMFTFYNDNGTEWNLCWNERQRMWITRYSWTPVYSENINNIYYSLDKKRADILSHAYKNLTTTRGLKVQNCQWDTSDASDFSTTLELVGYSLADNYSIIPKTITFSYMNGDEEVFETRSLEGNSYITLLKNGSKYTLNVLLSNFKSEIGMLPVWFSINVGVLAYVGQSNIDIPDQSIYIVAEKDTTEYNVGDFDKILRNGFFVHGRAGIFDEIDYFDASQTNEIKPTKWYNKQEPFEFEFVVNEPAGLHKIFNNLVIISNNVQPKELEFEIIGDAYLFNKARIFHAAKDSSETNLYNGTPYKLRDMDGNQIDPGMGSINTTADGKFNKSEIRKDFDKAFKNAKINYDPILNQYTIVTNQVCKNSETWGRRLGNIQYKEDAWYTEIQPLIYDKSLENSTIRVEDINTHNWSSTRIRDKWAKIRVKYTGENLVVITAIKTLLTLSYA